jgi:hypothetical protein
MEEESEEELPKEEKKQSVLIEFDEEAGETMKLKKMKKFEEFK